MISSILVALSPTDGKQPMSYFEQLGKATSAALARHPASVSACAASPIAVLTKHLGGKGHGTDYALPIAGKIRRPRQRDEFDKLAPRGC